MAVEGVSYRDPKVNDSPSHTVLARDSGQIKSVKLAALGGPAAAKGGVGLRNSERNAGGKGEDGGGELHCSWV